MARRWRWLAGGIVVLALMVIIGVMLAFPAMAVLVCPSCYGFQPAGNNVFIEQGATSRQQQQIIQTVAAGRVLVGQFWGEATASPKVLACITPACFQRIGGGHRRGMSIYDRGAFLSPRGLDAVIAAHELSMNELHHRIGLMAFIFGAVPIWFNEGVAMYASNDLRYLAPAGSPNRCLVASDTPLPDGMFAWNRMALRDKQLYAKAACKVSQWVDHNGGSPAAVKLINLVAAGQPFAQGWH